MITKRLEYGEIKFISDGTLFLREDLVIEEDGVELSRRLSRQTLEPGTKTDKFPKLIQDLTSVVWTAEVIRAYKEKKQQAIDILTEKVH